MKISEYMRSLRKSKIPKKDWSYRALSKRCGVATGHLHRLETDQSFYQKAYLETLIKVCNGYEIDLCFLFKKFKKELEVIIKNKKIYRQL